jgi:FkbM family methyltransferase
MLIAYSYNPQKIYVVEADPSNYQILKQNTLNNYLDDKVKLFNICISDKDDEIVSFGYNDENIKNTSTKGIGGTRVKVKTKTLESFLQTLDMSKINIIKIDTEGGEQYMENGLKYISKYSGINILLSIHTPFWTNKTETANMLIKQFGNYDVFTENEEKITENELMGRMLNEKPTVYNDKTGEFFTLILKTKIC